VAFAEDVGFDLHVLAHYPFDRESACVYLGIDTFDDHTESILVAGEYVHVLVIPRRTGG
jgi:hypothetical protein